MEDNTIIISRELAYECAEALVDQHNAVAEAGVSDAVVLISFRGLYKRLCALGQSWQIASAIRPVNERNLPLFD